jgi:hypothetical protein
LAKNQVYKSTVKMADEPPPYDSMSHRAPNRDEKSTVYLLIIV